MRIAVIGRTAYYAKYLFRLDLESVDKGKLPPWIGLEIPCYTDDEKRHIEEYLKKNTITYTVDVLPEPPEFKVTRDIEGNPIRYKSRTEVMNHILKGIEPESMIVPRLQEKLAAAEERAEKAEAIAREARKRVDRLIEKGGASP